ncbi:hypothetical protein EV683_103179 [Crenobacter luteus]|uniref:hypothetical protein n=1 Tax=Crenobacter luteus TaxID=1452487 RepID=UPI00104CD904|nr:hypothetical protein [Crenobacter luteus]TCP14913.1 hypothetical protein EV683_103179 [Crenobacter luteus]
MAGRPLTAAERALVAALYRDAIDPAPLRLVGRARFPLWRRPLAWRNTLWLTARWYRDDYAACLARLAAGSANVAEMAALHVWLHELVHVWQAQQGAPLLSRGFLIGVAASLPFATDPYQYALAGRRFADYGLEQQAALWSDYQMLSLLPASAPLAHRLARDHVAWRRALARERDAAAALEAHRPALLADYRAVLAEPLADPCCYRGQAACLGRLSPLTSDSCWRSRSR